MSHRQRLPMSHFRSPLNHVEAARVHCFRRAWERHGLALSVSDLVALERQIIAGAAVWIMDQKRLRSAYWVRRDDRRLIMIFDVHLWCGVTILPGLGFLKGLPG